MTSTLLPSTTLFRSMFWPGGLGLWRKKKAKGTSYYARAAKFTAKHSKLILIVALAVSLPATSTVLSRSEEHTSELQSRGHLVCRLLLEKKKQTNNPL